MFAIPYLLHWRGLQAAFNPRFCAITQASSLFSRTLELPSLFPGQAHHAIPLGDAKGQGSGMRPVWPQGYACLLVCVQVGHPSTFPGG